ncbi:hypothetical protein [Segatella copri]|uniref:hypothetical protein n=1 Tax=Segatella copri TaxID=165179 RepID=UPI003F707E09
MRKKKSYRIFLIALMTLSTAFGLSSCIDEDMSKCGKDYKIKYNLRLNTQIHTLIDIDLNTTEERHIANRLKQELGTVFTDHALDNDLSFFIGKVLYRHEANIMNANSVSYTIYLPRNDYQNLSLANTGSARNVKITGANDCKALALEQEQKDTINSHNIGLFTSRLSIDENDFEHDLQTTLYMANSSAVVVIDQSKVQPTELWGFVEGMATQFQVNDSTYSSSLNTMVKAKRINQDFITNSIPTHDALYTICFPSIKPEWRYHVIAKVNGKYTETIFTMNEPLKAGKLKIIKTRLKEDGSLSTSNTAVGVSVKLDWKPGGSHDIDI